MWASSGGTSRVAAVLLTTLAFLYFYWRATLERRTGCEGPGVASACRPLARAAPTGCSSCPAIGGRALLQELDTERFAAFTRGHLPQIELPRLTSILLRPSHNVADTGGSPWTSDSTKGSSCNTIVSALASKKDGHCLAYASVASGAGSCAGRSDYTFNLIRHTLNQNNHTSRGVGNPGFYEKVPGPQHRGGFAERMLLLFTHLEALKRAVTDEVSLLTNTTRLAEAGPVVIMAVNEGDLVLLLNFACSMARAGAATAGVPTLVFTNSPEMKASIDALGGSVRGIYHHSFPAMGMGQRSSEAYLDKAFGEAMWFKAMAAFIVAETGLDLLFQDADVVWFRNPFEYFAATPRADVYYSDNGLRTMRMAPAFANSGVYFVRSNPRSRHFLQSVLLAYDSTALTGSHQTVFNEKLAEALELGRLSPQPLPADLFPHGLKVVRDRAYMEALARGLRSPYLFHMCWTANKEQKMANFRSSGMLYLTSACERASASASAVLGLVENIIGGKGKCCTTL